MAIIRQYGQFPAMFVPDEGEVVLAARSPAGPFLRAVVTKVRRRYDGRVRIDFQWADASPVTASGSGAQAGGKGYVYVKEDDPVPLIRRVPRKAG